MQRTGRYSRHSTTQGRGHSRNADAFVREPQDACGLWRVGSGASSPALEHVFSNPAGGAALRIPLSVLVCSQPGERHACIPSSGKRDTAQHGSMRARSTTWPHHRMFSSRVLRTCTEHSSPHSPSPAREDREADCPWAHEGKRQGPRWAVGTGSDIQDLQYMLATAR